MKKRSKQITNLLKLGVFLFGISLLLWNCEKDNNLPQEEETGISQTSELYQAKNWLEKNENDLLILKYTQLIDWDNAILSHGIQGTIIEVPLILNENIVTKMESNKTLLSFHRLVLKKEASNMFSIFHLQITTSNTTFNNSNKAFNYYSLQQNFDGYTTLVDVNNKVASFNKFYQGKIITKPESIASREVMTCTYVGWWSNGTFEPISELWCTSEGGSNGEDDGESGYNYGGGGTTSGTTEDDIIDNTNNPCVSAIIKALQEKDMKGALVPDLEGMGHLSQTILDLFDHSQTYNLTFNIGQLNTLGSGVSGNTNGFDITLDTDLVKDATKLFIAKTVIHESFHAYIHYVVRENPGSTMTSVVKKYYQIYNRDSNLSEHQFIGQYVEALAYSLSSYDNHQQPMDYYKALSWAGLESSNNYQNLSSADKTKIQNIIQNERLNKSGAKSTKC
ncbi:hypothetical protein [Tenacibaculum discolor]|uniref:hypothetical protein n=1 Tax=Tenacibaculum discolor TaxID=361581 RepID=UPI0040397510